MTITETRRMIGFMTAETGGLTFLNSAELEVIGNVHENPELLTDRS